MKYWFKFLWPHCVKFIPVAKILNNALSIYVLGCVISTLDNILLANLSCSLFFSWLQIWRCLVGSMHKIRHDHYLIKIVSIDIWQLKVFIFNTNWRAHHESRNYEILNCQYFLLFFRKKLLFFDWKYKLWW